MDADEVWKNGQPVDGYEPDIIRKDAFGAWIYRAHHGKQSAFGWTSNGQVPLHWKNANSNPADSRTCEVTSNGRRNVEVGWVEV
ncbi:MAG: hypothetical protein MPJ08_01060 [Nitrosopumilus sp.]|nr:hypothetical protein [Nitrosopumilus sp.]